jgi:hypothetical protein
MPVFAGQSRDDLRRMYLEAWRKFSAKQPLEPLEAQLAAVIAEHPEYIGFLESGDTALGADFTPEGGQGNPFLHMGLHLAIREQVATDRPKGIAAEHAMLEPLAETIWEAQRSGILPDEQRYLERLKTL